MTQGVPSGLTMCAIDDCSGKHWAQRHPYSGVNLYVSPRGHRGCKTCRRDAQRAAYRRSKALSVLPAILKVAEQPDPPLERP